MKRYGNDPMKIDYCLDCGAVADECEKVSVCCGSPEDFDIEGFCPVCRDGTGFECKEEPDATRPFTRLESHPRYSRADSAGDQGVRQKVAGDMEGVGILLERARRMFRRKKAI